MKTLTDLLAARAAERADAPVVVDGATRRTYRELEHDVHAIADAMRAAGIGPGDRVAAMLASGLPAMTLYFAAARVGAIVVAVNWRLAPPEVAYVLQHSAPRLGFVSPRLADAWRKTGTAIRAIEVPDAGEHAADFDAFLRRGGQSAPGAAGATAAESIAAPAGSMAPAGGAIPPPETGPVHHDPLVMLFTSGTTGRPKGCVLGQRGQLAAAASMAAWHGFDAQSCTFVGMPLFHVAGLGLSLATIAAGGTVVFAPRDAQAADVHRLIAGTRCTFAALPPTLLGPILKLQVTAPLALALSRVVTGAGMAREADLANIRDALKVDTIGGYGQTEAGNFVAWLTGPEQTARPSSCGRVLPHLEARIVDGDGHVLPRDETGELQLRGASVFLGYWNDPAATAKTIDPEGWLSTGDLMRLDADGFLHFAGRAKELIKSGGENVYPLEVEQVLMAHPGVRDACVFGVPDRRWGEAVHAAVVLASGATSTQDELDAWCAGRIAGYKRPRAIVFLDAVPRDPNGKPLRRVLTARSVPGEGTA